MYTALKTELNLLRETVLRTKGVVVPANIVDTVIQEITAQATEQVVIDEILGLQSVGSVANSRLAIQLPHCYKIISGCKDVQWKDDKSKKWFVYLELKKGGKGYYDVGWVTTQCIPGVCYFMNYADADMCRQWLNGLMQA